MTRKHFEALAFTLKNTKASKKTCEGVALVCRLSNPNFDKGRFMAACGK